ncbi:FAD/NAD(P)-binding protein [Roseateles asaccharophilus]|uniref:NAD(P)/FAD-binding protein YdhS n=1 Tax=Roseateles asaccharophilus TaxID=582607 RepID=A0ABU2ABV8_9BURK|nr:FAD/NAD(P)-binding protein [Roseateles asaccharophilus]MDR7334696.1 putative NAD(P)/FAD-binding protein YdhS [Roseateles asaccharophilus]
MLRLAIVGGGFSAVALVLALTEQRIAADALSLHIDVFEPRAELGQGLAYAPWERGAWGPLLNVPAGRMGPSLGRLDAFATWWSARSGRSADFAPRADYGRFLAQTLAQALEASPWLRLNHCRHAVAALERTTSGWRLQGGGDEWTADHVVLAYGHEARSLPPGAWGESGWYADPWSCGQLLDQLPSAAPVLLLGSGLTAVDVWQRLALRPHSHAAPPVQVLSRHGWLPQPHRAHDSQPAGGILPPDVLLRADSAAGLMNGLRSLVGEAGIAGVDWRDIVGDLRSHTPRLWRQLPPEQQRRAARHAMAAWDSHRHRLAPPVATQVEAARRDGRLQIDAGRLLDWEPGDDGGWLLKCRRRNGEATEIRASTIVNCTGPAPQACKPALQLRAQGLSSGWYQPHPNGLGPRIGESGQMLDPGNQPQPGLWMLGPALRAEHWEATAVPELRQHAARLASALLATPRG